MNKMQERSIWIKNGSRDMSLDEFISNLNRAKEKMINPENASNIRIRTVVDSYETEYGEENYGRVELAYDSPVTDEEQKEYDERIRRSKIEQEKRDKEAYERIKKTYGWANPQEHKRRTGRTTRMMQKAIELAKAGRAVYVMFLTQCEIDSVKSQFNIKPELGIKLETPSSLPNFDWETLTLKGAHPNCIVLVDHHVIESKWHMPQNVEKVLTMFDI